jgi:aldehyde oxidoreductase
MKGGNQVKTVTLTVNGVKRKVDASPDLVLLDLLREQLGLTGTKQSCDRKGQCGACTVIVDGKATRSCLKKVVDLDGAEVISVEGLGTPENPHLIQEAYVLSGAIQCGYCTPGMIMATKALLDQNPNPDTAAIKKALARNLCRCTGYVKIIDAVKLAGKFLRGETTPTKVRAAIDKKKMIGESHPRPSSMLKACGLAKFGGDYKMDGMLEIAAVHSTEFHAVIKSIDASAAKKMPGVVGVMTADDIKGSNRIRVIAPDQPVLCEDKVRAYGDPVAIVAAETRAQARAAAAAVKVTYEKLPVMKTPQEALAPGAVQIHPHSPNLCFQQPQIKGDAEKALKEAHAVIEGVFSTQMNHQAALEPEACFCYLDGKELVVIGRSIMIHAHAAIIQEAVGAEKVRYIEPYSGGQFGIKASISSEGIAAAACMHWKRPIKYIPTLEESFWITSKRHPFDMKTKLAADAKGNISAYFNEFTLNKGAYFLLGPIMPGRALHMLNGSYNIPNIKALAKLVYTNNGSGGAARGAGPPQVMFALESLMDMMAEKLGIDALEFRKKNALLPGQTRSTGAPIDQTSFPELCDDIRPHYERAKKAAAEFNKKGGKIKRGVGIACMSFGIAEAGDRADNAVEINPDDTVTIYAAIADPGEGNDSMLSQLAAQVLGLPLEKIKLYTRDTAKTVAAGPSAGSRQTYMGGGALVNGLEKMAKAMKEAGSKTYAGLKKAGKPTRYEGVKQIAGKEAFDPKTGQSDSFDSQVHNIQMAEVEVNTETGQTKVLKMTTAVDAGPIIHPQNLQGQLEGGMDQGIGYALREEFVLGKSKDWITFKFPTINDSFEVEFITRETPRKRGTLGSTGIGEMTMVSTAPAVTNAIYNACGARIYHLPATPDKVKAALK